jgi:hypothetical protein
LALTAGIFQHRGDCARALPLFGEYLRLYPSGPYAAEAALRRARCLK